MCGTGVAKAGTCSGQCNDLSVAWPRSLLMFSPEEMALFLRAHGKPVLPLPPSGSTPLNQQRRPLTAGQLREATYGGDRNIAAANAIAVALFFEIALFAGRFRESPTTFRPGMDERNRFSTDSLR